MLSQGLSPEDPALYCHGIFCRALYRENYRNGNFILRLRVFV
jgi:hypothetical protein